MSLERVHVLPAESVVISVDDANELARIVRGVAHFARSHGATIDSKALALVEEISSATGATEHGAAAESEPVQREHIDVTTAARILGCTTRNVRDLASRNRLPGVKPAGRWLFYREDVEVFKNWRQTPPPTH